MKIINHTGKKILIHASRGPDQSIKKELDVDEGFDYEDNELGAIYLHEVEEEKTKKDKFILDVCCGGRMFWFNKKHPATLYIDIRDEDKGICPERPNFEVKPDKIMDFRALEFPNKSFKLVVFDPPQLICSPTSIMGKKFGILNKKSWKRDLKKGFEECWRVLDDYGLLIFKWSESNIPTKQVLQLFSQEPLFGHPTGSKSKTKWLCFMKIPKK